MEINSDISRSLVKLGWRLIIISVVLLVATDVSSAVQGLIKE